MSLEKQDYVIRTEHVPASEPRGIGKGDYGTIERALIVTELLKKRETGEWSVEHARLHPDEFVTKTFHRATAIENARHSVECYEALKAAGVTHLPGTHRISDSDPRVVISTLLGKDALLITANFVPENSKRPTEIDDSSFGELLTHLTDDLKKMSAQRLVMHYDDAFFFELRMEGSRAERVQYVIGDFDNIGTESRMSEKEAFRQNVIQATRSLFWLMMSQQVIPGADPESDNWARVASRIQLWADSHGVDAQEVYDEYVTELERRIAADRVAHE